LVVQLPLVAEGIVKLPDSLDLDTSFDIYSAGRHLTDQEVADYSSCSASDSCSICLSDLVPPEGNDVDMTGAAGNACGSNAGCRATNPVFQLSCGHAYHSTCIKHWFDQKKVCPQCNQNFGKVIGVQPRVGSLRWYTEAFSLPGHPDAEETIVIEFHFPSGVDESGQAYDGRKPKGYLPGNAQGILLLELFKVAFRRRVMFGLGESMTFGHRRPTFNIHIKTSTNRGSAGHGYPDGAYFKRALEELQANGVTIADLPF